MKTAFPEKFFEDKSFPIAEFFDESQGFYFLRKRMEINRGTRFENRGQHLETMMVYVAGKGESEGRLGIYFTRNLPADYALERNFISTCEFLPLGKIYSLTDLESDLPHVEKKRG